LSNATKEWKSGVSQLTDVNNLRVELHSKSIIEPILSRTDKLFIELDGDATRLDNELNTAEKWLSVSVWIAGFIGISLTILSVIFLIRLLKSRLSTLSQSTKN